MLTAWLANDHACVLVVGPHDRSASNVYNLLLEALGVTVPEDERTKPLCCDEHGLPPTPDAVTAIVDAVENLAKQRRRRKRQARR